jgi:hypothetical protein
MISFLNLLYDNQKIVESIEIKYKIVLWQIQKLLT